MKAFWPAVRWTIGLSLLLSIVAPTWPQTSTASSGQPPETNPLLLKIPETRQDLAACQQLAQEQLARLHPTTQATTAPSDETLAALFQARTNLYAEWEAYLTQIQRLTSLQESLATLSSEAHIAELTRQVEEFRRQVTALASQSTPVATVEAEITEFTAVHKEYDGRLATLSEQQTRRATQLASGFRQRRETLEAERATAQQARRDYRQRMTAATTSAPSQHELLDIGYQRHDVTVARLELALKVLELETNQAKLASTQDEQLVEALGGYVNALQQRLTALVAVRGQSKLEILALRIKQASTPHERALLELQYFSERALVHYFRNQNLLSRLQQRFDPGSLTRLADRVRSSAALWAEITESAEYRPGSEILRLRRQMQLKRREFKAELSRIRNDLGISVAEVYELQTAQDRALTRFDGLKQQLLTTAAQAEATERTRLETEATNLRASLNESIKSTIALARQLVDRLSEAETLLVDHLVQLQAAADQLYWDALRQRDSGLASLPWTALWAEMQQILGIRTTTAPIQVSSGPSQVEAGIVPAPTNVRARLGYSLSALRHDLGNVGVAGWITIVVTLVLAGLGGWLLRWYAGRLSEHGNSLLESMEPGQNPEKQVNFAARLHLLFWNITRDVAIPLLWLLGLWLSLALVGLADHTRLPALAVLGTLLAVYGMLRIMRHLLHADARRRIAPCSDYTAWRCRRWFKWLLLFSAVILPSLVLLSVLQVMHGIHGLLWEGWKTGVLLILLVLLLRWERSAQSCETRSTSWVSTLIMALHPLMFVALLGLLILEIIGYGVLVEFLGMGVLGSLLVVLVISAIVEYLGDLLERYAGKLRCPPTSASEAPLDRPSGGSILRLLRSLLRVAGFTAIIVLILYVWGASAYLRWLNWQLAALLTLVVVTALIIDRVTLTALSALEETGRLPQLTARIIRRWLRGFLTAVVVLLAFTLAGARTDRLWAPLSALLAMLAVGFVAVWSLLSNILATLFILIWRPFNVGEHIEIRPDGIAGKVVDINFLYTLLRTDNGAHITVPNSLFVQKYVQRDITTPKPPRSLAEQLESDKPAED
ncbi:MAG: mechanosensitive ion channel domain-containing protein [Planctomycetota bacterium]